jgi:multicomponent Na+:H+ antiporter subunit D
MLAYSSAAQIGYIYLAIGIGGDAGFTAAILQLLAHALTKPLLFLSAGRLSEASGGSSFFRDLRGAAHRDRFAGICFLLGSMSMIGIPLFAGFSSKMYIGLSAISGSFGIALVALLALAVSTMLNALYFMRTVIRIYTPETEVKGLQSGPFDLRFVLAGVLLIAANFLIGIGTEPIAEIIRQGLAVFG